jgi:NAD+ kinase
MSKIFIFANRKRSEVDRAVSDFEKWLAGRGEVVHVPLLAEKPECRFGDADVAVVFGGDGSMLRAARWLGGCQVPVVGVNMGHLGFLVELDEEELRQRIDEVLSGKLKPVKRLMLQATVERRDGPDGPHLALNDVVVRNSLSTRMLTFGLSVNAEEATSYNGDGLVISTPVGSTAYSLSAGGPIVVPGVECLVITPICPHSLANRSLVLTAKCELRLNLLLPQQNAQLTLDGQETMEVTHGEAVVVKAAPQRLNLIETGRRTFFQTLREKMHWEGHPDYGKK